MTTDMFLDMVAEAFPGKELKPTQAVIYREKLRRFSDDQRRNIYDQLLENCKYYPRIADVYEQARELGYLAERHEYKPHVWEPSGCGLCDGAGLMATFWTQEFELREEGKVQCLKLTNVVPYHRSSIREHEHPEEIRTVFRCSCERGVAKTLEMGIPRWSKDHPLVIERRWS